MLPWFVFAIIIIFYWKFVYYKYHETPVSTLTLFTVGAFMFFVGMFYFISGYVSASLLAEIYPVYAILVAFMAASYSLIYIGFVENRHHINKHIDITLTLVKKLGFWRIAPFLLAASFFLVLFMVVGSRFVLGQDYFYIWIMLFVAWTASDARLVRYIEKIHSR